MPKCVGWGIDGEKGEKTGETLQGYPELGKGEAGKGSGVKDRLHRVGEHGGCHSTAVVEAVGNC